MIAVILVIASMHFPLERKKYSLVPREVGGAEGMGLKLGRGKGGKGSMIRYGMGERGGRPIPLSLQ